jgi:SpoVK/Ycf46/Vps4 family AAA+-type ATPase
VLFFDEADALLGNRSEVEDAHDRYANVEIAYLLHGTEGHGGVTVLASNPTHKMDKAFGRIRF